VPPVSSAPLAKTRPASARVALIDIDPAVAAALTDCFTQMGVAAEPLAVTADLAKRKYEGCVVDLRRSDAEGTLEAARSSPRNRRIVLFGIYSDPAELRRFSRFGINALFALPFKRLDALKVLRSTQTLLLHELRRYARIPLATSVELAVAGQTWRGMSRDLSGGGMSLQFGRLPRVTLGDAASVSLIVPPSSSVSVRGVVCWIYEPDVLVGVQFSPDQEALKPVRKWVDGYLGID
jgi:hypothetical protein